MKVAIVGLAPSSRHLIPRGSDWELWGLPWDDEFWCQLDRQFDIHHLDLLKATMPPSYFDRLRECGNLYMQEAYAEIPNAKRFPLEMFEDYFSSTIAFALAMAIQEGAHEIGLYGIDMNEGSEYAHQRPNLEYLIGLARGKGIAVHIPAFSPLCKFQPLPGFAHRYGYLN